MRPPESLFDLFKHCPPAKILQITIYPAHPLQEVLLDISLINSHFLQLLCDPAEPDALRTDIITGVAEAAEPDEVR